MDRYFYESCASCRHWMIGSTDYGVRRDAYLSNRSATCHVNQPSETKAQKPCCDMYLRALMGYIPTMEDDE